MYQSEPATEKQHKYFVYLCKGIKGMTAPEMGKVEDHIIKRYESKNKEQDIYQKLWSFSDLNKDQMIIAIDVVSRFYNGNFKDFVKNSSSQL